MGCLKLTYYESETALSENRNIFERGIGKSVRSKKTGLNYYTYGLSIDGLSRSDEYLNKYTSKELQTGEFDPSVSSGLEMFDFHARFYDPALGRWFVPDPAEQFSNPYLAMGNNPVMYVDPDGEFIIPMLIGAGISVITNGISNSINGEGFFENAGKAAIIGGIGGAFSFGIGQAAMGMDGIGKLVFQTLAHGHLGGVMSGMSGGDYGSGFLSGAVGSLAGAGTGAALKNVNSTAIKGLATVGSGAISGGIGAEIAGGDFWDGARNGAISAGLNHAYHASLKPKIFVDNFDESLDFEEYKTNLQKHLIANGFSSRTEVLEFSAGKNFWAWAKGNPTANVSIRDSYSRGAPIDGNVVGYAQHGSDRAVVYGKGNYPKIGSYSPSTNDLINVTTHELGHAIFSFSHLSHTSGVMNATYRLGSSLLYFNPGQQTIVLNSQWGGR